MSPYREESLTLREVCPVVEQVCLLLLEVLAVVTEKLYFWKSKLPVHMNDALALEGMVVGTWVGVGFVLVGHVHGELELQGTSLKKRPMLLDRFSLGDRIRRWSSSASRLPVFQQGKNIQSTIAPTAAGYFFWPNQS
jgi:hypothetical protein